MGSKVATAWILSNTKEVLPQSSHTHRIRTHGHQNVSKEVNKKVRTSQYALGAQVEIL